MPTLLLLCLFLTNTDRTGTVFLMIGHNRTFYTQSDMTFSGPDFNFKLDNVSAHDDPHYFVRPDLSQYVLQAGYFFHDKYFLSLTITHMKYLMNKQNVTINGNAANINYEDQTIHVGNKGDIVERFEHTNGLNLADIQVARVDDLIRTNKQILSIVSGASVGMVLPVTDSIILGQYDKDRLLLKGYALALSAGVMYSFLHYGLLRAEVKGGFIDVRKADTAASGHVSHNFWFIEPHLLVGAQYDIF